MTDPTKCRLCADKDAGIGSHIIPKLVLRAVSKHFPNNDMRTSESPNRVTNDLLKIPFLCKTCDNETLGALETAFNRKIFAPYFRDHAETLEIDDLSYRCLVSISWRVARYFIEKNPSSTLELVLADAEKAWREYLLGLRNDTGTFSNYLILSRDITKRQLNDADYMCSSLEYEILMSHLNQRPTNTSFAMFPGRVFVVTKMGPMILLGQVRFYDEVFDSESEVAMYESLCISPGKVIGASPRPISNSLFQDFVKQTDPIRHSITNKLSEEQKNRQQAYADKHLKSSPAYKHIKKDLDNG